MKSFPRLTTLAAFTRRSVAIAGLAVVLAGCSVTVTVDDGSGGSDVTPQTTDSAVDTEPAVATPPAIPPDDADVACSVTISTGDDLQAAVNGGAPGDVVCLAGGEHRLEDTLAVTTSGEDDSPITLRSAPDATAVVVGPDSDPAIELIGASWWVLTDLEITGGDILLRLNGSSDNEIQRSVLHDAGGECVRIRDQSQRNRFADNVVYACGLEGFNLDEDSKNGEGVYIGTAPEQRERIGGVPDQSSENIVERSWFRTDGSEAVDIKEDSERNVVRDNVGIGSLDPDGAIFGSRGDRNEFLYNEALGGAGAGFRTGGDTVGAGVDGQVEARIYGADNVFRGNDAHDNSGYGYRFMIWPQDVDCTNTGSGNADGLFFVDDESIELSCTGRVRQPRRAGGAHGDDDAPEDDVGESRRRGAEDRRRRRRRRAALAVERGPSSFHLPCCPDRCEDVVPWCRRLPRPRRRWRRGHLVSVDHLDLADATSDASSPG
jgi:hypothetical protein